MRTTLLLLFFAANGCVTPSARRPSPLLATTAASFQVARPHVEVTPPSIDREERFDRFEHRAAGRLR